MSELTADDIPFGRLSFDRPAVRSSDVDIASLLHDVRAFIQRYVVLSDDQAIAVALWVVHTHSIRAADCTPYLQVTSATKRAGKTRLLEVLEPLVARPWFTGRTSAAALVRKVDDQQPTLLLDESDAAFNGDKEFAQALRGILNSGYRRSGKSTLCIGQGAKIQVKDFATFSPKAIAGIGKIPDTVADRSIPIVLRRRTNKEPCARWRERDGHAAAKPIHEHLCAWADDATERLRVARPELPSGLGDRQADVWEPLFAIADLAGGKWPTSARRAALTLCGEIDDSDVNVELLRDIRTVFDADNASFVGSTELAKRLAGMSERPWADWRHGKPISPRAVADRLKQFSIVPRPNESGSTRGYYRDRFEDAWARYPSSEVPERQHSSELGTESRSAICQNERAPDTTNSGTECTEITSPDGLTLQTGPETEDRDAGDSCDF